MRISRRGQITIPKRLRDQFGLNHVEIEITPTDQGLLIRNRTNAEHPVERVYGILWKQGTTTATYIEEIRGR